MKSNCFIRGNGVVENGTYEKVEVCGTASFGSDVYSNKIVVNGSASMGEKIESGIIEINGSCSSAGSVKCKNMFINGSFKGSKLDIVCETLNVKGKIEAGKGKISSKAINVVGIVCAKSMYGDSINICAKKRNFLTKLFVKKEEISSIKFIEGKQLEIDNIVVEHISCDNITVGKKCCIKELNCTGVAKISKGASVKVVNGTSVYK